MGLRTRLTRNYLNDWDHNQSDERHCYRLKGHEDQVLVYAWVATNFHNVSQRPHWTLEDIKVMGYKVLVLDQMKPGSPPKYRRREFVCQTKFEQQDTLNKFLAQAESFRRELGA